MKKTLIAAGIAAIVAAPVAMADVKISGQVKYTITNPSTGNTGGSTDNNVTFSSSEDLGNGLTAFATLALDTDNAGGTSDEKDAKLGIKGNFGTIVAGRMETLTEGVASAKMDDGRSTHSVTVQNLESVLTVAGRVNAVAYVSPTVNGFHAAVAATQGGNSTSTFDDIDMLVAYDNGPLSLMATRTNFKADGAASVDKDVTTLTASYNIGDVKVTAQHVNSDAGSGADYSDKIFRLDYTMGNNVIMLGMKDADTDLANNVDVKELKLTHKFSKQTAVYVAKRDVDSDSAVDYDDVYFGMIHKF